MKNKRVTYFLIVIVIVLWGAIIQRVFAAFSGDHDDSSPVITKVVKESYNDYAPKMDTTKLLLNYRDPFGLVKEKDTLVKKVHIVKADKKPQVIPAAINWSFITYSGFIRNPVSKKLIALVNINGQNLNMAEGDYREQVKLLKNLKDSIKISYQGKTKFIVIKSSAI